MSTESGPGMNAGERDALLGLSLVSGLGPTLTRRAMESMGSAARVWEATAEELASVPRLGEKSARQIRAGIDRVSREGGVAREKELMAGSGTVAIALSDAAYPLPLKHIPDPPPLLYVRGRWQRSDAIALGVVGSRKCTRYGREQADRLCVMAAQSGLCVVSGGARGIDAAAHRAALRVGGRTVAVIGSGLMNPYPKEHGDLFDEIVESGGAVMAEVPMTAAPVAENFPRRNRIISGLSLGVLVVEAALRSGALITARVCAEEHNRELMALPGRIDSPASAGCHKIIREGWATLVTSISDILEALGETGEQLATVTREEDGDATPGLFSQGLTAAQHAIVEGLGGIGGKGRTLDELAEATRLGPAVLRAELTMLQVRGMVESTHGRFMRKR